MVQQLLALRPQRQPAVGQTIAQELHRLQQGQFLLLPAGRGIRLAERANLVLLRAEEFAEGVYRKDRFDLELVQPFARYV